MSKDAVSHYNPPSTQNLTRCGLNLRRVKRYTSDKNDATCNNCVRLIAKDTTEPAPQE